MSWKKVYREQRFCIFDAILWAAKGAGENPVTVRLRFPGEGPSQS